MTLRRDQNIQLKQGDYKQMKFTTFNRLGQRVSLNTGTMQANYQVRSSERGKTAYITKSLGDGITFDPVQTTGSTTQGVFYITIDPADTLSGTANHLEGPLYHEGNIIENGLPNIVFDGEFEVLVSVVQ
ncbi:hypothetical protein LCGC14_1486940 [marine sediment metagenome]|uniref:Uncharacterized protein n=1 Tax=marine sediment metagenome TaxID=412755 RepID=A0A0F9J7V4_9ZZZZ